MENAVWQQLQQHPVILIQRVSHMPQRNIQPTILIGKYMNCQGFLNTKFSNPIIIVLK